jgi:succinate-semialdehyde dehydrogenase / glutarate-semialdehyde dehydrogenase
MATKLNDESLLCTQAYIDGKFVDADSGATFGVDDPATGEIIANVAKCGAAETQRAIAAAERAQKLWAKALPKERGKVLRKWAESMMENDKDLGTILSLENGKPLAEGIGEIAYAAGFLEWFGEEARRVDGSVIATNANDRRILALKQPIGVTASITPWNFPAAMIARKVGPAVAVGCSMVAKPAGYTPLSAIAMAVLAERAGLPAGVFNVVPGDTRAIGGALTSSSIVRKLTFTGSTEVGKVLLKECADTVKKISMELGGNAPFIVFDDADVDAAIAGTMIAKFRNTGQTCVAANRIYVQAGVYDQYIEKLADVVSKMVVGRFDEPGVTAGPMIDDAGVVKVEEHVGDALDRGGKIVVGGARHERGGRFYQPTVISGVTADAALACEETFGPVAGVIRFESEDEAVRLANDTPFGLAAYFYARDLGRVWRVAEAIESGMIGINTGFISAPEAPFGGVKESGLGREGSRFGIDDYLEVKYLAMGGLS